jgi:hypothetical protein
MHCSLLVRSVVTRLTTVSHFPPCFVCTAHVLGHCRLVHFTDGYTLHLSRDSRLVQKQVTFSAIQCYGLVDVQILMKNPSDVSVHRDSNYSPSDRDASCSVTELLHYCRTVMFLPCIHLEYEISTAVTLLIDKYIEQNILADPFLLSDNHSHRIVPVNTIAVRCIQ